MNYKTSPLFGGVFSFRKPHPVWVAEMGNESSMVTIFTGLKKSAQISVNSIKLPKGFLFMGKRLCFLFVFCVGLYYARSQQILFNTYAVQNGLVANPVRTVFQDKKGLIWIATWEGISKYDGYRFTNFSTANGLSHNLVNDFFEKDDKLLVAENDGTIDAIQNDRVQKIFKAPSAVNRFVRTASGAVLLTTDYGGVYEFSQQKFFRPAQQLMKYPVDRVLQLNDSLFIAHGGEETVQLFTSSYRSIASATLGPNFLGGLLKDSRSRTWLCTSEGLKLIALD